MAKTINYTFSDEAGDKSTTSVSIPDATTEQNTLAFARGFGEKLKEVTDGRLEAVTITLNVDTSGWTLGANLAANDSRVEEGIRYQMRTNGGFNTSMRVPTFKPTMITAGKEDDQSVQAVIDLRGYLTSGLDPAGFGGVAGNVSPCDRRGDDIVAISFGREQFLRSRNSSA